MDDAERLPTLVLGATGAFGGALAHELMARGAPVRVFARSVGAVRRRFADSAALEIVAGDAQDRSALIKAAEGCGLIVHGVNYPYDRWVPFMHTATLNVIAAARASGAVVLFPGNVYGLGRAADTPFSEQAPTRPSARKGRFRVRLEGVLSEATQSPATPPPSKLPGEPIRVLIVRAGDYFGPTARNGLVDRIFGNAAKGRAMQAFGRLEVAHQWAYLPDLARAALDLAALGERLAPFEVVNFAGPMAATQRDFLETVAAAAGHPGLAIRLVPWAVIWLMDLFDGIARELVELRYLFETAVLLDDNKLRTLLPGFEATPLEQAVETTLASYRK